MQKIWTPGFPVQTTNKKIMRPLFDVCQALINVDF